MRGVRSAPFDSLPPSRDVIKTFLACMYQGWEEALNSPKAAAAIIMEARREVRTEGGKAGRTEGGTEGGKVSRSFGAR